MAECLPNEQPATAILMALYEPDMEWLLLQLQSLNAQTYSNLRLYIRDDCSPTVPYEQMQACVRDCITQFPYEIHRNERNLGSNATFELLTQEADGALFAYCDQDDIWLPEKLLILARALEEEHALLACSDMFVIDGMGHQRADSITAVRRHHVFRSGDGLAAGLLTHNFVTGCTMLVSATQAKAAIPFCPFMVHDHYLALWCAERGNVLSLSQPLIRYRIHGGNQTGILHGVVDKASYGRVRLDSTIKKLRWLQENFPCCKETRETIGAQLLWLQARQQSWNHCGGAATVWKYRRFSPLASIAELFLKYIPNRLFMKAVSLARKNRI